MADCKDIPCLKDFNLNHPLDVQTGGGVVQLFPFHARRGTDEQRWDISIDAYCLSKVEALKSCDVFFRGAKFGGNFSRVTAAKGVWEVTFQTTIPNPEFWGEPQLSV